MSTFDIFIIFLELATEKNSYLNYVLKIIAFWNKEKFLERLFLQNLKKNKENPLGKPIRGHTA